MCFRTVFLCVLVSVPVSLYAQLKKPLDQQAIKIWKTLGEEEISSDGKWFSYEIKNDSGYQLLVVGNTTGRDSFLQASGGAFCAASQYFLWSEKPTAGSKDRAFRLMQLSTKNIKDLKGYVSVGFTGNGGSLLQLIRSAARDSLSKQKEKANFLVLFDPVKNDSTVFPGIVTHRYSKDQQYIVMEQLTGDAKKLLLYHLPTRKTRVVMKANLSLVMTAFSASNEMMACLLQVKNAADSARKIFLVDIVSGKITDSVFAGSKGIEPNYEIAAQNQLSFSGDGKKLFFKTAGIPRTDTGKVKLTAAPEIWKWDHPSIPPMKRTDDQDLSGRFNQYTLKSRQAVALSDDEMIFLQFPEGKNEAASIGFSDLRYRRLEGIEAATLYDSYIVDMNSGKRKLVLERKYFTPKISTDKQFISWYEPEDSSWYCMNTRTLAKKNLSKDIPDIFYNDDNDLPMHSTPFSEAAWDDQSHWLLVPGKYDCWKIDASGKYPPVCLTRNMGVQSKTSFRRIKFNKAERYVNLNKPQYFTAFQNSTKMDGYFVLHPDGRFEELVFSAAAYGGLKISENGKACLYRKGSFTEYPELYHADAGFKNIQQVSATNRQQAEYWWGTASLETWQSFGMDSLQGILCKPENFDPRKKYPMIVYFYEKRSDQLHRYPMPENVKSVVNWSYCVSNGYLVFIPDIVFKTGQPGMSAYNAIVSGVLAMMEKYDFIDKNRIGINGHSWGGYQAAYLLTKTNLFRAAVAGAVVSNMTSAYGGIRWETGRSRISQYEYGQSRMGIPLWNNPLAYMNNSPLFGLTNVQTPLLIMHNDQDGAVPREQGIELFMGLRRLGKPAWMLNYKGEGHLLKKEENKVDFTNRVMDFFDYFLKDKPRPGWL